MHSIFPSFSHIYIEKEAREQPLTGAIVSHFPKATIIEIDSYREIFNHPRQNWRDQKESQKLILAVKHGNRVHPATEVLPTHRGPPLYYTSPVMNCLYDCQYCFLQAMYRSANMVVFVNEEDFYAEVRETIHTVGPITLSISYDSDLLAAEKFIPWTRRWIKAASEIPGLTVEIRTKSANFSQIKDLPAHPQVILAWSMAPEPIWERYEHLTAPPQKRRKSIKAAIDAGWRTRICFDPVLPSANWEDDYRVLIRGIFDQIEPGAVEDVSVGVFRMGEDHLRNFKARNPSLALLQANFSKEPVTGIKSLSEHEGKDLSREVAKILSDYLEEDKIILW